MSELSDQINQILEDICMTDDLNDRVVINDANILSAPHADAMSSYYEDEILHELRICYYKSAGSYPYQDTQEALDKTYDMMMPRLNNLAFMCLSDGVQMGQGTSFPFKKYNLFNRLPEVFSQKGWRETSDLLALQFTSDDDTRARIHQHLEHCVLSFGSDSGYSMQTHPEYVAQIWDVYYHSMRSVTYALYAVGHRLGAEWVTRDTLAGIEMATEQTDVVSEQKGNPDAR